MNKKGFTYTLQIDAEINDLIAKTNTVKKSMESIMSAGKAPGAEKIFGSIERAIERLQQKAAQPIESVAAFSALEKDAAAVGVQLKKLGSIVEGIGNMSMADKMDLLPPDLKKHIEDASAALATFSKAQAQAAQKTQALIDAENDLAAAQKELKKAEGRVQEKQALIQAQQALVDGAHEEANAIKAKIDALKKYQATAAAYEAAGGDKRKAGGGKEELAGMNLPADRTAAKKAAPTIDLGNAQAVADEITRLGDAYSQASKAVTDAESTQRRYSKQLNEANNAAVVASGKVTSLRQSVAQLNQEFEKDKTKNVQAAYTKLRTEAGKLGVDLKSIPVDYTEQNLIELNNAMNKLAADGIAQVDQGLNTIEVDMESTGVAANNLGAKMTGAANDVNKLDAQVSQTQAFTQRIAQFVGLEGGIEIARSAMRNAISTIKELDKAMTEMAVVTDLDVGDYWDQLPEHTERANALGMSIKSVYEAETLYYQQGLKTNEVVTMSTETLKMARIAGLSAEDATNKMTAALRGFNMELNETSAQRVADVYSELAAITASDVDEISSAMTKTASIASSAGMEFETTAAFLSQIIETTRESAETAGTALKTVIARFQELKKDPAEIGEVDGEIVDANKIETALRTVGVSLRDASGQFRELDDVFLELSSKWDTLDTNTQRYIATVAAGSRQQSRFIAMMSDYSRTQELVTAANSSAGASNEQFEKTMDSLESKLAELKNAWDSFTMGIMDSEILKTGIDLLTGFITAINNITDAFGQFSGAAKIGLLIAALYLGDKALKVFTTSIKGGSTIFQAFGKIGSTAASSIKKTMTDLTKAIKNTTKQEKQLNLVLQSTCGSSVKLAAAKEKVKKAQKQLNDLEKSGTATSSQLAAAKSNLAAQEALLNIQQTANNKIRQESQAMVALGLSATQAEILALQGHTAAEVQNLIAKEMSNGISAEEARQRALNALGIKSETGALTLNDLVRRNGILNFLTQLGLLILGKKSWKDITNAENKNTGSKLLNIIATLAQAAANGTLLATMWPILVATLAIAAAAIVLVSIIMLLVAAFKNAQKNSPEGKLKSAEEAAEAAGEAAERAAEAFKNLSDGLEQLDDKYDNLENLTRGTKEWKEAVKEVNAEVLGLIEKYPELAGLVENKNGVLTLDIESKEVQDVLEKYENKAAQASAASYAAKINVNEKKAAVRANEVNTNKNLQGVYVSTGEHSGYYQDLTQGTLKAVSQAIASGDIYDEDGSGSMVEEISDWLASNGTAFEQMHADVFAAQLDKATDELKEFGNELNTMDTQDQVMYEQMAQDAINTIDTSKFSDEQIKQMDIAATADYSKAFNKASQAELEKAIEKEGKNSETFKEAKEEVAKNLYGEDATVSGNKITYKDENGDEQTKELTEEEFKEQWAAIDATRNMTAAFEQLPKTINKISSLMTSEAGKAFKAMYAGKDGSSMTKSDLQKSAKYSEAQLKAIWGNLSLDEQSAYGSFDVLLKQYNESWAAGQEALAQATEASTAAGIEVMDGISMEAARGYANQMRHLYLTNQAAVDGIDNMVNDFVTNMNDTDKTKFMTALNALDWSSVNSLETLPETLTELGIAIPQTELNDFINNLIDASGAIRTIDINKLKESANTLVGLGRQIQKGDQGRSFSEESYKALVEMAPELAKEFQVGLDGSYTYLGSSMDKLRQAIEENTEALLKDAIDQLNNKIGMAEIADQQTKGRVSFAELANGEGSKEYMREQLKIYQQNAANNGIEIIGIDNFDNDSNVDKLSLKEMKQIFSDLASVQAEKEANKEAYSTTSVEAAAVMYQGQSMVDNAYNTRIGIYQDASLEQRQEFDARTAALMSQAMSSGVNSQLIDQYAEIVDLYKQGVVEYSEVLAIQQELANTGSYSGMMSNLKNWFEGVSEISEQYHLLSGDDVIGKINMANEALAKFGIEAETAAQADAYMALVDQVSQGSSEALATLIGYAQEAAGIPIAEQGNAYTTTWKNLSDQQIAFFDKMANAGMGYWQKMEGDEQQFVWATADMLGAMAEEAGTLADAWENPYTWLYNYNEEINRVIKEREKSERAFTRALEKETSTTEELLNLSVAQLNALEEEAALRSQGAKNALSVIEAQFAANEEFAKYVGFDPKTGAITVDFEGLDAAGFDKDKGEDFEEFVAVIEENRDVLLDSEDALEDIEDQIAEIKERGKDETSELYNQIKEGLIQSRQEEIDALQSINDSIQEAQANLVDKIQEQIDDQRQARENEKAENEIADKETRLAYLMRDTSGGNALEIASLQQEIAEAKQSHTDNLVDQSLQNLQDANTKAAEQRQQQIDLAQLQLDSYANSAVIWKDVQNILTSSLQQATNSTSFNKTWMETQAGVLSAMSGGIKGLNPIEAAELKQELTNNAKLSALYTGVATIEGTSNTLADEAADTTTAVNNAKSAIDSIKQNAASFGQISNEDLSNNIGKVTGSGVGSSLAGITSSISKVNPAIQGSKKKTTTDLFEGLVNIKNIISGNRDEQPSENEKEKQERLKKEAVQSGVSAITAFTSGGGDFKNDNAAYQAAKKAYEAAGGKNFDKVVSNAIGSNDSNYNYGEHYDSSKKKIVTGTFPDTKVKGLGNGIGNYDTATFTFADGASAEVEVPQGGTNKANEETAKAINKMYSSESLNPANGWVVLYKDVPYVYNKGYWRYFGDKDKKKLQEIMSKNLNPHFKTGGLADFTGPAWLDGTKSRPELVLNQTDTANFIVLKDILAEILDGASSISKNKQDRGGDNYYEVEINVENISDDYDVEQMAEKIKSMIYDDAIYRNVNSINNLR